MNNLLTSVMTKITTGPSALSTDVGGRVYLDQAPAENEYPYIVFFIVSDTADYMFSGNIEDVLIQFSIFSQSQGATEITTIYNDLKSLFDDCSLTIPPTGTEIDLLVYFKRENLTTMVEDITTPSGTASVKHWIVEYSVKTQKK